MENQTMGSNLSNPLTRMSKGLSKTNIVKMNTSEEELQYLKSITLPALKKRIDAAKKSDTYLQDGSYDQLEKEWHQVQNRINELEKLTPKTPAAASYPLLSNQQETVIRYEDLKRVLFTEIDCSKRNSDILIEAYLKNPSATIKKATNEKILDEAVKFLTRNEQNLYDIHEQISAQCFRRIKYEELLAKYYDEILVPKNNENQNHSTIELQNEREKSHLKKETLPATHYDYDIYSRLVPVIMHKNPKIQQQNIRMQKTKVTHIMDADQECGYLILRTYHNEIKWIWTKNSTIKGYAYIANDHGNKLLLHCYSESYARIYRFYINGEPTNIGGNQQYLEKMIRSKNPTMSDEKIDLAEYILSITTVNKNRDSSTMNIVDPKTTNINTVKTKPISQDTNPKENVVSITPPPSRRQVNIQFKDFVVRRNIFKCMHSKHTIEDIDAAVKVMNKDTEIETVTVPAGYCKQCNIYFMMESTYQQLRKKGIVVFRAIDEKNYLSQNYLNGKLLAQESILMQFGYSVSKSEGLSETRRHKILSVLVDNHIMTKSEIISYLDFFINQRKSEKFAMAVAKWTIDRNYIRNYRIGEYSSVGFIYRND